MRKKFLPLFFLACTWFVGGSSLWAQATIESDQVRLNGGTNIVYEGQPVSIETENINLGLSPIPAQDSLELLISIDGDAPTRVTAAELGRPLQPAFWPLGVTRQSLNHNSYNIDGARFRQGGGGGGVVHNIIIWPTKITGGSQTQVTTRDSMIMEVAFIQSSAFRVQPQNVLGLPGNVVYDQRYDITIVAENIGSDTSDQRIEFYLQVDEELPRRVGWTMDRVAPGNQHGLVLNNFRVENYYPNLDQDPDYFDQAHALHFYVTEQNEDNNVFTAAFQLGSQTTFPVELADFTGEVIRDKVDLSWQTSLEINNSHFRVEKENPETGNYELLATIEGAGTTQNGERYAYTDAFPNQGTNVYRLVQVDLDGAQNILGQLVEVHFDGALTSPVEVKFADYERSTQHFAMRINAQRAETAELAIYDVTGRLRYQGRHELNGGISHLEAYLELEAGVFIYRLKTPSQTLTNKLRLQ